jgi:hypothetical protein
MMRQRRRNPNAQISVGRKPTRTPHRTLAPLAGGDIHGPTDPTVGMAPPAINRERDNKMGPKQAALVTGANKGIGLAVARGLARGYPDLTVLVGARDPGRGHAAVCQLQGEGLPNVEFIPLDVTDTISINAAHDLIDRRFSGSYLLDWRGTLYDGFRAVGAGE